MSFHFASAHVVYEIEISDFVCSMLLRCGFSLRCADVVNESLNFQEHFSCSGEVEDSDGVEDADGVDLFRTVLAAARQTKSSESDHPDDVTNL